MNAVPAIRRGLDYLTQVQNSDGSFRGHASSNKYDFTDYREHLTSFFTALILDCVAALPAAVAISGPAATFLLEQRSERWSWNYWIRGSDDDQNRPYPDDLDDTACALAGLSLYNPDLVDGTALGHFAQQLVANESAPGGPYETWLIDRLAQPAWQDIDVAVNANIGYCLSLQGVQLPELNVYMTKALSGNADLLSSYYESPVAVLYFIARWYRGVGLRTVRRRLAAQINQLTATANPLDLALLLQASLRAEIPLTSLLAVVHRLLQAQRSDGSWPAAALYYEPLIDGVLYHAGSEALTTAFAVEALSSYEHAVDVLRTALPVSTKPIPSIVPYALRQTRDISDSGLRRQYSSFIHRLAGGDSDQQVLGMASQVAQACGRPIAATTIRQLNLASMHGWLAYTIYDDFWDDEGRTELLSLANIAMRRSLNNFRNALPADESFAALVATTFDQVDSANNWEVTQTRAGVDHHGMSFKSLPDYGDYGQLASRSRGHMLAALGVLYGLGYAADSSEATALRSFFHHFLIARQLNDDAHDWEEDLAHGHLSAVVTILLAGRTRRSKRVQLPYDLEALRHYFWETAILEVTDIIQRQVASARQALRRCAALRNRQALEGWLQAIESATELALRERDETQKFITSFANESA